APLLFQEPLSQVGLHDQFKARLHVAGVDNLECQFLGPVLGDRYLARKGKVFYPGGLLADGSEEYPGNGHLSQRNATVGKSGGLAPFTLKPTTADRQGKRRPLLVAVVG